MNCRESKDLLAAYTAGNLHGESFDTCKSHLAECDSCREELESYACLITFLAESPSIAPSHAEVESLENALRGVRLPTPERARLSWRQRAERISLAVMSILTFAVVALISWMFRTGKLQIASLISPASIALIFVVIVIVGSFIPIAVTAKRKPLNGATFRR